MSILREQMVRLFWAKLELHFVIIKQFFMKKLLYINIGEFFEVLDV